MLIYFASLVAIDYYIQTPRDQSRLLRQALSRLSDTKREMLYMSRFEHMKYEEIARIMGCQIGTVKSHIHWAMKELAAIYKKLTKEETP